MAFRSRVCWIVAFWCLLVRMFVWCTLEIKNSIFHWGYFIIFWCMYSYTASGFGRWSTCCLFGSRIESSRFCCLEVRCLRCWGSNSRWRSSFICFNVFIFTLNFYFWVFPLIIRWTIGIDSGSKISFKFFFSLIIGRFWFPLVFF